MYVYVGKGVKRRCIISQVKLSQKLNGFSLTQKLQNNKYIIKDVCIYSRKDAAVIINCFCLPSLEHFSSTKSWAPLIVRNLHDCGLAPCMVEDGGDNMYCILQTSLEYLFEARSCWDWQFVNETL